MADIYEIIDRNGNHNPIVDMVAQNAITAIKDGTTLDSFGDVETALDDKVDKHGTDRLITAAEGTKLGDLADIKSVGSGLALNSSTGELTATGISITIDSALDGSSTNPVQNRAIYDAIDDKQDVISDLATIRSGASAGATAIQPSATTGLVKNDGTIDTTAYATTADLSSKQDTISDLATIRSGATAGSTAYQKPSGGIPDSDLSSAVQTSLGKADTAVQSGDLASVATSGSYTDLSDKPTSKSASSGGTAESLVTTGEKYTWNQKVDSVSISTTGTASSTAVSYQRVGVGDAGGSVSYTEIKGTKYMEQSVSLSTSATTAVTFTNSAITASSVIEFACSKWGLVPDDITVSNGSCVVTMPKVASAETVSVRIYLR